jgi:hypothetical protein
VGSTNKMRQFDMPLFNFIGVITITYPSLWDFVFLMLRIERAEMVFPQSNYLLGTPYVFKNILAHCKTGLANEGNGREDEESKSVGGGSYQSC